MKKCLYCAEMIQDEAVLCRYCGRAVTPAESLFGGNAAPVAPIDVAAAPAIPVPNRKRLQRADPWLLWRSSLISAAIFIALAAGSQAIYSRYDTGVELPYYVAGVALVFGLATLVNAGVAYLFKRSSGFVPNPILLTILTTGVGTLLASLLLIAEAFVLFYSR